MLIKKVALTLTVGLSVVAWSQSNIKFEDTDFKTILAKAKKENKLVFMDAYASWCGPCKMMEKNVFTDPNVASYYNTNFVNAHFDMEKGEGKAIAKQYMIRSYPTYLFLNGDGEVVGQDVGYIPSDSFIEVGKKFNTPNNTSGTLQERYDKGDRELGFLVTYFKSIFQTNPQKAQKISEEYFKNKKDSYFSQDEINMLFGSVQNTQDVNYQYVVERKSLLSNVIGEVNYNQFIFRVNIGEIIQKSADIDKKTFNDTYFLAETSKFLPLEEAKHNMEIVKLNFYQTTENWKDYEKSAVAVFQNGDGFAAEDLIKAAVNFNTHYNTKATLEKALTWAEKALMIEDSYRTNSILAQLYFKLGKKLEAKTYAKSAIAKAQGQNIDLTELIKIAK